MDGAKKFKPEDPQPGTSAMADSSSDDNAPLARRKDAKGKVKKSSTEEASKVPKGKDVEKASTEEARKVPKGNDVEKASTEEASKVPKGKEVEKASTDGSKKVPKGTVSVDAAVEADDEDAGGDLELTPAEVTQGFILTRKKRVLKVIF